MMLTGRRACFCLILGCEIGLGFASIAASEDGGWQNRVATLESQLFANTLKLDEIDHLLDALTKPDARTEAAKKLAAEGHGHIDRIIVFANGCEDIEVRQCCVEIVESLDASYRTTDLGRRLCALYREHADSLLPKYWQRFRKNSDDLSAVAMLMSSDAEQTYAALGKTGDRHDPLRYLLLRIRELSPDEFTAKHLAEHTAPGVLLVLPDLFPLAIDSNSANSFCRARRAVGQSYLGVFHLFATRDLGNRHEGQFSEPFRQDGMPAIGSIVWTRRRVATFRTKKQGVCYWEFDRIQYSSNSFQRGAGTRGLWGASQGLARLPELTALSQQQEAAWHFTAPWWAKPYVPTTYHKTISFAPQRPGEKPPELIATKITGENVVLGTRANHPAVALDPTAPAVIILPPLFGDAANASAIAAGNVLCDRLAAELGAEGIARVVDRTQIDRVLQEKRLSHASANPALGFDALVRFRVEVCGFTPTVRLSLVDLSHGNVMKEMRYDWPVRESDLPQMARQCREGLRKVAQTNDGRLKVRCLEVNTQDRSPRLSRLADRLGTMFDEAIARSPKLDRVWHWEAGDAKEESLLQLMDLSRLPGGRRFSPQSDAAIELSIREGDGLGKTFEQTPVVITVRLTRGTAVGDQSFETVGTVAAFDRAATDAWTKLAGLLQEAKPGAAAGWLEEMAIRRKQAEAELRAAAMIVRDNPDARNEEKLAARLAHAETAMKLDPNSEDAISEHIQSLREFAFRSYVGSRGDPPWDVADRVLTEALAYFERFGENARHRGEIHESCRLIVETTLRGLVFTGGMEQTPQRLRMFQKAKAILEDSIVHNSLSLCVGYQATTFAIVGRAMKVTGMPRTERWQWIDWVLKQCSRSESLLSQQEDLDPLLRACGEHHDIWICAIELAVDDNDMDRARSLITQLQGRMENGQEAAGCSLLQRFRAAVTKMDDAASLAQFERWVDDWNKRTVEPLSVRWPDADIFRDQEWTGKDTYRVTTPPINGFWIRRTVRPDGEQRMGISAIAVGGRRLYAVMESLNAITWGIFEHGGGSPQSLAYVPLDEQGRPLGESNVYPRADKNVKWDNLKVLQQPSGFGTFQTLAASYWNDKLYLGTWRDGLLAFDPATERWTKFGTDQGLPEKAVFAVHPLDNHRLLCIGMAEHRPVVYSYTFDPSKSSVTLLHQSERGWEDVPRLFCRTNGKLMAWSQLGFNDDILSPQNAFHPQNCGTPYGWGDVPMDRNYPAGFVSIAECDGRRFVTNAGLHEFDASGKILKSWWRTSGRIHDIPMPPDCPINSDRMVVAGPLLVFIREGCNDSTVVAWNPKLDLWYGPLLVADAAHALGTPAGVWIGTREGLVLLTPENITATAEKVGRAMTTAEYRRRQQAKIAAMSPLDRAKVALSVHQFDEAEHQLKAILEKDPRSFEAMLLLGYTHDSWCRNQPQKALECYRRLAAVDDRNASFTGHYQGFVLLRDLKRWPELAATAETIERKFARAPSYTLRDVHWWRIFAEKQIAAEKQSAAGTSNKRENERTAQD